MEHIEIILTSFFTLVSTALVGWYAYNQKTKDKMTDFKIEQVKKENEEKAAKNNRYTGIIFGELWHLLNRLETDRCFILQPHPAGKSLYVSVILEVCRKSIASVKNVVQNVPVSDISKFAKALATIEYLHIDDVDTEVDDMRAKSLMKMSGSIHLSIRQLINYDHEWVGSLVVENLVEREIDHELTEEMMRSVALTIQFILPPIN